MITVVAFEEDVVRWICGHAPQIGRSLEVKQSFYDQLKCEWDMHSVGDLFMCLGDVNGFVGRHIDALDGVHGGYDICQRNLEERMLLEFCQ